MTEPPTADAPIDIPEADLLEQQTPWQDLPKDAAINSTTSPAVTDGTVDEGDVIEQAQPVVAGPDDDDDSERRRS